MQLIFSKYPDKPPTLSCVRDDGSVTWQSYGNPGSFFPVHDLTHFAVETELGYRNAFLGMIASGRDLNDFGPGDAAMFHPEAHYAEMLAGLLTVVEGNGSVLSYEAIKEAINQKAEEVAIPPIALIEPQLECIRAHTAQLTKQWKNLPDGEKLFLKFAR